MTNRTQLGLMPCSVPRENLLPFAGLKRAPGKYRCAAALFFAVAFVTRIRIACTSPVLLLDVCSSGKSGRGITTLSVDFVLYTNET